MNVDVLLSMDHPFLRSYSSLSDCNIFPLPPLAVVAFNNLKNILASSAKADNAYLSDSNDPTETVELQDNDVLTPSSVSEDPNPAINNSDVQHRQITDTR
ncbi:hypothetical protein GJ496_004720 [Pomphorhynchus laevis]|nr:hypothetical protein GJ496_004720 [Pomphorhynchus laevis]